MGKACIQNSKKSYLTDFFDCKPGYVLCESDLSVMHPFEEEELVRYKPEMDILVDASKFDVDISYEESMEPDDVDFYVWQHAMTRMLHSI